MKEKTLLHTELTVHARDQRQGCAKRLKDRENTAWRLEGGMNGCKKKGVHSRYFSSSSDGRTPNHAVSLLALLWGLWHVSSRWAARVSGTIAGLCEA